MAKVPCRLVRAARMLTEDQIKTTFADVAGCDEAEEVAELVEYLREPKPLPETRR